MSGLGKSCKIIVSTIILVMLKYRVTHKGWDFRDDCKKFILSVSLYSWSPTTASLFLSLPNHLITYLKDLIHGRKLNLTFVIFKEFQVVFTVSSFVDNPAGWRMKNVTRGTSSPFSMIAVNCFPLSEPDPTSSRSRSPEERWVNPYLATILSHWVPFPHPGPPRTQTIGSFASWRGVLSMLALSTAWNKKDVFF